MKQNNYEPMNKQAVQQWIRVGPNKALIDDAERFGTELKKGKLSTTQIRHVFTKLKGIEAKGYKSKKVEFLMLKPLMAYAASRQKVKGLKMIKDRVSWGIDEVLSAKSDEAGEERFKNFCRFFEAILAYHKAAGGK